MGAVEVPTAVLAAVERALAAEPEHDVVVFLARLHRHWPDLVGGLGEVYGETGLALAEGVALLTAERFVAREPELRLLDLRRHVEPDWFQSPRMLGYAAYADRFAGTLRGVAEKADYLRELGVTYLHLLPLLEPRSGPDDGGYAVKDFRAVRSDLGSFDDLAELSRVLRANGISLALDLVLNHVAAEHEWAVRARAGDERHRRSFHLFDDRTLPDAYERTLPEVFPDFAPGSFTFDADLDGWVWTTFNAWQWDLAWSEPEVFAEFVDLVLLLANQGVECLRLDAIAFLWKRLGTDCQNQPEVHALTQALRAVARIGAPALVFKAEAIVGPRQLAPYLGQGRRAGKLSDLAYHNGLMVQVWSALATGDGRLLATALRRFPPKPTSTSWATYLRCHDDIGWAIDDDDAAAVGWGGPAHRSFLSDYYSGSFPGSDARGLVFQENATTGDRRISGTAASLAGLEAALDGGDERHVDLAVRRLLLAHLLVLAFGGLPVLWMGDELALRNDPHWEDDPAHTGDNRWAHRPRMPWDVAERRHLVGSVEHRVFSALRDAACVRAGLSAMHASVESVPLDGSDAAVYAHVRRGPAQVLVAVHNLSEQERTWRREDVPLDGPLLDALTSAAPPQDGPLLRLAPYAVLWLVEAP